MSELTENQQKVLEVIKEFQAEHGYPPTIDEMAGMIGKSKSTIYGYLIRLEKAKAIRRKAASPRTIEIVTTG
jgi:repressor LexA